MISGGPTDGDSSRTRKSHELWLEIHAVGCSQEQAVGPIISFGPQDLEGLDLPHDDALIIKAIIATNRVARVFVDTGSSVNVLFRLAFEEMQIDASELQLVATSLYGFTSNEVRPMGQIKLVISLGSESLVRTRRSTFLVVYSPSSYNVILGRPALHEFRAAVSTFHQKIKFLVGEQVEKVRGEQRVSKRCYIGMVKEEAIPIAEEPIPCEEVQLYSECSETLTRIAGDLSPELKEELIQCLIRNRDVFAWSTEELPGVKLEVVEHKLHLLPDARPLALKIAIPCSELISWWTQLPVAKEFACWTLIRGTIKSPWPWKIKRRNAGAIYQRMMEKIFRKQAGRNVEVYVDDILIKSPLAANLIDDVDETCGTLRQYRLKLNPLKRLFGVKGGKFLGYLVKERGIEANPEKARALQDMKALQNLKEAQKLVGKITTLSRFISRSVDKVAPFFKVLRKASKFQWDEECTWAFEELKKYLETLPSLFKSITGEPLWVYLSATPEAVGVVLVKEQDNVQRPVYFSIHLLKGAESQYTALENLFYGLVLMARRLRPYFLAHPITVLTNSTMGKALTNVEVAGRLIKWTTELREYNITYQPHTTIKAEALADFLTKVHQTDSEETWKVYVDGSATRQGSGVEYDALLAGLQAACHVGAARVIIYSDSQLVTQQVTGNFEINCDKLQVYREAYEKMKEEFKEVTVSKIPRAENGRADELAKMASSLTTWVLDRSIAQAFLITQIDLQNNQDEIIDWRAPMISYLQQGILPTDLEQARLVRKKAHAYTMIGDQLYKWAFSRPLLKRFLLVAVDYFFKWVEAEALARITESAVIQFLWRNILCRFGIPHKLVSDNGRQFQGRKIHAWCRGFGITQLFTSLAYPQSNRQTEIIKREIVRGLKIKLDHVGGDWVEELQSVLWTYCTTPRESTGLTLFHLVYGNEAVVPMEVGVPSTRRMLYNEENSKRRLAELDIISETRERTAARLMAYRQRMRQNYDRKVTPRFFGEGDLVWKRIKPVGDVAKLAPQWDGPYKVIKKLAFGTYYLQDGQGRNLDFIFNLIAPKCSSR
ncbi:uncharacterized protein LOC122050644 [Zingiber officinale]|uniref:uncharacterized protein LOC122050644 n=1 Tax=Zingiber officinale TaxID=94328 RepID=UPI001C4CB76C|nr:uncharacterized protein LOC122050644 [Zingiber officinale]